eukprot:10238769-Prorocentrum_lima.AAC.1
METDDQGQDWCLKLHIPTKWVNKYKLFKDKWSVIRPDVSIKLSDKYHSKGELSDGVYAEIHK